MLKTRAKTEKGDENRWQDYFAGMPLNRPALVTEVSDVAVYLCSDRAAWLTGITINVDGGGTGGQGRGVSRRDRSQLVADAGDRWMWWPFGG